MLKTVSLEFKSLIVIEDISKDLKICEEDDMMVQELWTKNAVPPPIIFCLRLAGETGRGVLIRVKSGGVAFASSATLLRSRYKRSTNYSRALCEHVMGLTTMINFRKCGEFRARPGLLFHGAPATPPFRPLAGVWLSAIAANTVQRLL